MISRVVRHRYSTLAVLLLVGSLACAPPPRSATVTSVNSDVITREELIETGAGDLYQVVERLRPLWLRSRGIRSFTSQTEIAVLRDGAYFGPVEILRTIPTDQAFRLEYVDAATVASMVPGSVLRDHVIEAAIVVSLSQAPR